MFRIEPKKLVALFLPLALLSACREDPPPPPAVWERSAETAPPERPPAVLNPASHADLAGFFRREDYDWETLGQGVPSFVLETLPADLHQIRHTDERKRIFFLSMLPMVLLANEEIERQRAALLELLRTHDLGGELSAAQDDFLGELLDTYEVKGDPLTNRRVRSELLRRVDTVPPSLALAQAATESAYGTSRFARRANNLFGEWTFIPGTGLVPRERPEGATYEVRRFDTVYDSVRSYLNNLNTHKAYRDFRRQRATLRQLGQPLRGLDLADGLELYSTRRQAYVQDLRNIIRHNRLSSLSGTALRSENRPADREGPPSGLLSTGPLSSRHRASREETRAD